MRTVRNRPAKKFFYLEFTTRRNVIPTAKEVCESILKYAIQNDSEIVFLSTEMPVRFYLDGTVYTARRGGSTGSPIILCYQDQ